MARSTRSCDSLYTSAHLHNFQPTETLRDTMAKKDELDADLVVEIRRALRSRQLQHGELTYSCWNSHGEGPVHEQRQRWSDVAVINVRSGAVDVGRSLS